MVRWVRDVPFGGARSRVAAEGGGCLYEYLDRSEGHGGSERQCGRDRDPRSGRAGEAPGHRRVHLGRQGPSDADPSVWPLEGDGGVVPRLTGRGTSPPAGVIPRAVFFVQRRTCPPALPRPSPSARSGLERASGRLPYPWERGGARPEEHTSELQSRENLVWRLL